MMDQGPMSPYQCGVPAALTAGCRPPPSSHRRKSRVALNPPHLAAHSYVMFLFLLRIQFSYIILRQHYSNPVLTFPTPPYPPQNTVFSLLLCVLALYFLPNPPSYECVVRVSASAHAGGNDTVSASGQLSDTPDLLRSIPDVYTDVPLLYTQGGKWLFVSSFQYKHYVSSCLTRETV